MKIAIKVSIVIIVIGLIVMIGKKLVKEKEPIAGGFIEVEDGKMTNELTELFERAVKATKYQSYRPIKLLAKQVVAGINYCFLVYDDSNNQIQLIVYQDLKGNASVLSWDER